MIALAVVAVIVLLAIGLVIAVALDPGPSPSEVAVAYERARDRHDGVTLWGLAAPALRGTEGRREFVAEMRRSLADAPVDVVRTVVVEDEFVGTTDASVLTRVEHRDGSVVTRRTRCTKHQGSWRVQTVTDHTGPAPTGPDASTAS